MKPCDSCTDNSSAREKDFQLDLLRAEAKQKAINEQKAKAICTGENGFYIADASTAITERYLIKEFVSHL